MAPPLDQQPLE
jgi:hypothetical protein